MKNGHLEMTLCRFPTGSMMIRTVLKPGVFRLYENRCGRVLIEKTASYYKSSLFKTV